MKILVFVFLPVLLCSSCGINKLRLTNPEYVGDWEGAKFNLEISDSGGIHVSYHNGLDIGGYIMMLNNS